MTGLLLGRSGVVVAAAGVRDGQALLIAERHLIVRRLHTAVDVAAAACRDTRDSARDRIGDVATQIDLRSGVFLRQGVIRRRRAHQSNRQSHRRHRDRRSGCPDHVHHN